MLLNKGQFYFQDRYFKNLFSPSLSLKMILRNVCLDLPELPLVDNVEEVGELLVNNLHEVALHVHLPHPPDHSGIPGLATRQAAVARLNLGNYENSDTYLFFS